MTPRALLPLLILIATIFSAGCSTAYKAALDERSLSQQTSDAKISAAIMKAYLDDDDVSVMGIEPYTFIGHVYLVGEYENYAQRSKAIAIAKNVEGVTGTTTYLLPKKEDPTCDTTENLSILAAVKSALIGDGDIWSTNIEVKVVQCQVVLLGLVKTQAEINKSIAHAKAVEGVRKVKSYLRVSNKQ
ncbi:BON domain-containing protein [Maridesulfovibrio salexigens]|uniref:Transport-associated n=1 Tax=Maridesulfovibrio salexigens (strain ATCC 14822 / DSM 2638 / NCIMB 8403 / VKM B-1763) TaxID=526222 RepID=C6BVW0_MARSD|nr:BON domain-containing protein [Maridesulfovibrio salexigens]ACS80163.1 transport-associated [Maridesulfovibrio salexigens DSM 2638]